MILRQWTDRPSPDILSANGSGSCYQFSLLLNITPVIQLLFQWLVTQGEYCCLRLYNTSMYSKAISFISVLVLKRSPYTRAFLKLPNPLSVGALSQQLPQRLIEQTMPYFASFAWNVPRAYWRPRSKWWISPVTGLRGNLVMVTHRWR